MDVVVGGMAILGGITMIATMTPLGVIAGAIIIVNGVNTISKAAARTLLNDEQTEGIFSDGSMEVAEYMGFSRVWASIKA